MATSVSDLMSQLDTIAYNPSAIQRAVLQTLSDVTNGAITVVDPTSPFVFALESAACLTSYAMSKDASLTRQQYPYAAQTLDDLYLHMSDTDYVNRFAVPATDTFYMLLPYQQLLNELVLDPTTGVMQIIIPRNTKITVADTVWSIQYPIIIRQLAHGGLQIVYDTSEPSPLQTLSSNVIPWQIVSDGTTEYLQFSFEVMQFDINSLTQPVNASTLFQYQIAYVNQFYYARVYYENSDGTWTEMQTTHTPDIYDITTPTAVLEVMDGNILQVTIPQIYTATGVLNSTIRMDIYTTNGAINMVLSEYSMGAFAIEFISYDTSDPTVYSAPLATFSSMFAYSQDTVNGGSNGVDFATLQQQVINNSVGPQVLPISNVQLQNALTTAGFTIVTSVDNITDRVFLATRAMPTPTDDDLLTAAGSMNATVQFSLDSISAFSYTIDNSSAEDAMTLTPDALFQEVNGVVSLVPDATIALINGLPPDQKALIVSSGNYLYTPFHYVFDSSNNGFAVRPYYLDAPQVLTKLFVSDNDLTQLQVNTGAYSIARTATGYTLQIQTVSGASFQALDDDQVFVQLAYTPEGEKTEAYLNGVLIGKDSTGLERIYQFDLSSTMNVDANNNITLEKFLMFTTQARLTSAPLTTTFDILYATTAVMPADWESAEVDGDLGRPFLPLNVVGITHEQLQVQFGTALETLWARARSVPSTVQYEVWTSNIPWTYEYDVYQADPVTGSKIQIVDGQVVTTVEHHAGDPVLDDQGNPTYQYVIGQVKLDNNGQPIVANPRGITQQVDFMLIEGVYKFATDTATTAYRTQIIQTIIQWLTQQLVAINNQLLEQTELYFYPQTTLGQIPVMYGPSLKTTIEAGQSLTLTLYVTASVFNNAQLKTLLTNTSTTIISAQLQAAQVSRAAIVDALTTAYGDDVIDAELTGLGSPAQNLPLFTILDGSIQASLRKKLVPQSDNSLLLTEDLTINWVVHDESLLTAS